MVARSGQGARAVDVTSLGMPRFSVRYVSGLARPRHSFAIARRQGAPVLAAPFVVPEPPSGLTFEGAEFTVFLSADLDENLDQRRRTGRRGKSPRASLRKVPVPPRSPT